MFRFYRSCLEATPSSNGYGRGEVWAGEGNHSPVLAWVKALALLDPFGAAALTQASHKAR